MWYLGTNGRFYMMKKKQIIGILAGMDCRATSQQVFCKTWDTVFVAPIFFQS